MPELPEVEAGRRTFEKYLLNSKIVAINLREQGGGAREGQFDEIVCGGATEDLICERLIGKKIVAARRRGKQLYFEIQGGGHLLFHFGMTGSFCVKGLEVQKYINVKIDSNYPPRFTKLELQFANGRQLAFADPRRLGRIKLVEGDPLTQEPLSKLARDPLLEGIDKTEFAMKLQQSGLPIKALLLDQEKVLSGIGNYLADEVLYQSGIHPSTPSNKIGESKANELATAIESVLQIACDRTERNEDFPKEWLFHYRWGKGKSNQKMPSGLSIVHETIGGRTTAVVPEVQKKTFATMNGSDNAECYSSAGKGKKKVAKAEKPSKITARKGRGKNANKL